MRLPNPVRSTVGAVQSHLPPLRPPTIGDVKTFADQAPAQLIGATIKGVELGVAGYAALLRVGLRTADVARKAVETGSAMLAGPAMHSPWSADAPAPRQRPSAATPDHDPWTGGALRPADDIREVVVQQAEDPSAVAGVPAGAALSHDELPLADYDHLTLGELRARIRRLGVADLVQLREYEHAHADRLPVVKAFDSRLATLAKQAAAQEPMPAP